MRLWPLTLITATACLLVACNTPRPPEGVKVVNNFNAARYTGVWYEIARLDNRFERGLINVTAEYGMRKDGAISVTNRGQDKASGRWKASNGVARFTGSPQQAALKVSFFGPFYGGYNIIALDEEYRHALVCGPNRDYLWLLSRQPTLPESVKQACLKQAAAAGFPVQRLIWVDQADNLRRLNGR